MVRTYGAMAGVRPAHLRLARCLQPDRYRLRQPGRRHIPDRECKFRIPSRSRRQASGFVSAHHHTLIKARRTEKQPLSDVCQMVQAFKIADAFVLQCTMRTRQQRDLVGMPLARAQPAVVAPVIEISAFSAIRQAAPPHRNRFRFQRSTSDKRGITCSRGLLRG